MRPWTSTMPVLGLCNAATQASAGSSAMACAASMIVTSSTPLASARSRSCTSASRWPSSVATTSLPQRRCATPRASRVPIQQRASADAQPRLLHRRRVVQAGVDHFAVAGTDAGADAVLGLDDEDLVPGQRERPGTGEADDAGTDDDGADVVQARPRPSTGSGCDRGSSACVPRGRCDRAAPPVPATCCPGRRSCAARGRRGSCSAARRTS